MSHRAVGSAWIIFLAGLIGFIIPDIATRWLEHDNRFITRLGAGALLLAGSVILAEHHLGLDVIGLIRTDDANSGAITSDQPQADGLSR
jgi:hypothetical protein